MTAPKHLTVISQTEPIDANYFRTSEVAPRVSGDTLIVHNWTGRSRAKWSARVISTVKQLNEDVICVKVIGWHKFTVSPVGGYFYFVRDCANPDLWSRRTANHKTVKAALQSAE